MKSREKNRCFEKIQDKKSNRNKAYMIRGSLRRLCALTPSSAAASSRVAVSNLTRCGADVQELTPEQAAKYLRPAKVPAPALVSTSLTLDADEQEQQLKNAAVDGTSEITSDEQLFINSNTGPVCDLSLCGVVRNTALGPEDEEPQRQIRCEIVTSWVSPSRGVVSQWVADRQVFRVAVRAESNSKWHCESTTPFRDGAIVYLLGKLHLRPMFDATSFTYHYLPELVLSDEFGVAECVMHEKCVVHKS